MPISYRLIAVTSDTEQSARAERDDITRITLLDPTWDLVLKILAIVIPGAIGLLGAWNISQGQRITLLTAGRESDRKDRDELKDNVKFWHDEADHYLEDLKTERTERTALNSSYVALATRHDETRSQLGTVQDAHRDLNVRFEKKVTELDQVRSDMSKQGDSLASATSTIDSLQTALLKERSDHDDNLTRMNNDHTEKQGVLQKQIDKLTADLITANDKITELHRQIQDFNSVNMQLARKLEDMTDERDALAITVTALQGQLAAFKARAEQPDPTPPPPDARASIPTTSDVIVTLPQPSDEEPLEDAA